MCGIAGIISLNTFPSEVIGKMTDLIRHRGPDDEGFVLFQDFKKEPVLCGGKDTLEENYHSSTAYAPRHRLSKYTNSPVKIALGHRRLSIIDLSALGHQPMCSMDKRYWIIFNGEIYNHIELRIELEQLGHRFISHTDTEVILVAFQEWGKDCLHHFNGMWAFLIYDQKQGHIFASRDHFGIKPLYYRISKIGLVFASEIKQFTALPDWRACLNGQRAYDFLSWGITDHTDETLFSGVFQIRPGHAVEFNLHALQNNHIKFTPNQRLSTYQWYKLEPSHFSGTFQEAADVFREKFDNSIQSHLRSDVEIGSCLSGGLDSSAIVCVANQQLKTLNSSSLQKTFSACSDVEKLDERKWVDIVVQATGVEAHYIYPALNTLFSDTPNITWHQDEPFGSSSIYAQWSVFDLARKQGIKVMLDGQGADEQLAGYHSFFSPHLAAFFNTFRWGELLREMQSIEHLHGYSRIQVLTQLGAGVLSENIKSPFRSIMGKSTWSPTWLNTEKLGCTPSNPYEAAIGNYPNTIQGRSLAQLTTNNLQMLLHWEDRNSMAHSIEARVPFLDHQLVEFVLGLPDEYKLSRGMTKRVLRQSMNGVMPDGIRNRISKLGFVTPEETWLRESKPELFRAKLEEAVESSQGILNEAESLSLLNSMIQKKTRFNFVPWRMINFGEWMDQYSIKT